MEKINVPLTIGEVTLIRDLIHKSNATGHDVIDLDLKVTAIINTVKAQDKAIELTKKLLTNHNITL